MKKTDLLLPLALLLTSLPCAAQGPLSPPGPPAPTMKTLEQIEPRTPISSLPCTISQPGSYYVVSNLHSTTDGIVIETSGVSVDLMGFSLTGDGIGSGDYGIHVVGATNALIDKVVIKNGTVTGFYRGLYCEYMNNSRIEQMVVSGNNSYGVFLDGDSGQCDGNTIRENTINKNTTKGIRLYHADGNRVEANNVWGTTRGRVGNPDDVKYQQLHPEKHLHGEWNQLRLGLR